MKLGKVISQMTLPELENLRRNLNLTDEEVLVFDMLSKGKTIIAISDKTNTSTSTVSNRIKEIREKMERLS